VGSSHPSKRIGGPRRDKFNAAFRLIAFLVACAVIAYAIAYEA
jgi:hypothetical protein